MKYGNVALGVECALPARLVLQRRASRTLTKLRRLACWLLASTRRWA